MQMKEQKKIIQMISDAILIDSSSQLLKENITQEKKGNTRSIQAFEINDDGISKLYEIKLLLNISKGFTEANMKNVLGEQIQFKIEFDKKEKYFFGIITDISFFAFKSENLIQYEIILRPNLWKLTQNNNYRCWTNKSSKDVITYILNDYNIKFKFHTTNKNGKLLIRKNLVQYGESDFDFLCRLLHEDGMNFIIEQADNNHSIVFSDDIENYFSNKKIKPTEIQISTNFKDISAGYSHKISMSSSKVTSAFLDSREFNSPKISQSSIEEKNFFKWESHPNLGKTSSNVLEASSNWPNREAIRINTLKNSLTLQSYKVFPFVGEELQFVFTKNEKKDLPLSISNYVVANIIHKYSRIDAYGNFYDKTIGQELSKINANYCAHIVSYPKENSQFLASFKKQAQHLTHTITATVYGKESADLQIERNESGILIGISFFWQTPDKESQFKCSQFIWARLSQFWASKNYGAVFIPQPGDEVLINFIDNDIDQPVIVASLYNSKNQSPINLSEKNRGLVANEEQNESIQFSTKSNESSIILNETSFKTIIKNDKANMTLDAENGLSIHSNNTNLNSKKEVIIQAENVKIKK